MPAKVLVEGKVRPMSGATPVGDLMLQEFAPLLSPPDSTFWPGNCILHHLFSSSWMEQECDATAREPDGQGPGGRSGLGQVRPRENKGWACRCSLQQFLEPRGRKWKEVVAGVCTAAPRPFQPSSPTQMSGMRKSCWQRYREHCTLSVGL